MYDRVSKIDELTYPDHHYLSKTDNCYYFGEYTARKGFSYSQTNQLILNLKKSVDTKNTSQYTHKLRAIQTVAQILNQRLQPGVVTFIPMPPSKCKSDPLYDGRMISILEQFKKLNNQVDFRELITQTESTEASHNSETRLSPDDLKKIYTIDHNLAKSIRGQVFVFDDMLTTGSHYSAAKDLLLENIPDITVSGLFVARRAPEAIDWDFDALLL